MEPTERERIERKLIRNGRFFVELSAVAEVATPSEVMAMVGAWVSEREAQAREEGRREGLEQAAQVCENLILDADRQSATATDEENHKYAGQLLQAEQWLDSAVIEIRALIEKVSN